LGNPRFHTTPYSDVPSGSGGPDGNPTGIPSQVVKRVPRPKILIVDDEERILKSTQMLLDVLGYDSVTLRDASKVHQVAAKEHPDLILQDLKMPSIDLPALLKDLKADPKTADIPFVLFSASPDIAEKAAHHDASGYLTKPFREAELLEILDRSLPVEAKRREGYP
jgi:CheY-like chemotaxis protein